MRPAARRGPCRRAARRSPRCRRRSAPARRRPSIQPVVAPDGKPSVSAGTPPPASVARRSRVVATGSLTPARVSAGAETPSMTTTPPPFANVCRRAVSSAGDGARPHHQRVRQGGVGGRRARRGHAGARQPGQRRPGGAVGGGVHGGGRGAAGQVGGRGRGGGPRGVGGAVRDLRHGGRGGVGGRARRRSW